MSQNSFIFHIFETFFSKVVTTALGVLSAVLIARSLGPEKRGYYAIAIAIVTIGVQFGNFGLNFSNTYIVSKNKSLLPQLIGNTLLLCFILGGGIAVFGLVVNLSFPSLLPVHGLVFLMVVASIPFALAYYLIQNLLLGIQEVRSYNVIDVSIKVLSASIVLILVIFQQVSVSWLVFVFLLASFLSFLWSAYILNGKIETPLIVSRLLFEKSFKYGVKPYLAAFFAYLVLKSDLLIIQHMLGNKESGYYSIASTLAELLFALPIVISTILFPKISAMSQEEEKWNLTKKTVQVTSVVSVLICVALFFLSDYVVLIMFGEAYLKSITPFVWLLPGVYFLGLEVVLVQFLNSTGFPSSIVYLWVLATLLNIILNLALISSYGISGAAISSSISYFFVFVGVIFLCYRTNRTEA